jgi:hypothetical protein
MLEKLARVLTWVVGIAGIGWLWFTYVDEVLLTVGRRAFEAALGALVLAALVGAAGWYGYCRGSPVRGWMIGLFLVWAFIGYGVWSGHEQRSGGYIADYCAYGAVSQAQLDACIDHVVEGDINGLETNAAQFARREFDECRVDAGPFCEDFLQRRLWEDVRPGPWE